MTRGKTFVRTFDDGASALAARLLTLVSLISLCLTSCAHRTTSQDMVYAQLRYDIGMSEMTGGNVEVALREFQTAIDRYPAFSDAHNAKGLLLHVSLGRLEEAEESFRQAIRTDPGHSEAHNNIGALYIEMGRLDEAVFHLRRALADGFYTTPHEARTNLGWALHLQGRHEEGVAHLTAAVEASPGFCKGYRNLGRVLRDLGREEQAAAAFEKFVEKCPDVAEANYEWGRILYDRGMSRDARSYFRDCVHIARTGWFAEACNWHIDVIVSLEETEWGSDL